MMKMLIGICLMFTLCVQASAAEFAPPEVPVVAAEMMPQKTENFGDALQELLQNSMELILPEVRSAKGICSGILFACMLCSLVSSITEQSKAVVSVAGAVSIAAMMLQNTNAMIRYASETVRDICEYGKLLCPVMTSALAAQGGITTSAVLYTGTTIFITVLNNFVSRFLVPMIYVFLTFSIGHSAVGEELLTKIADAIKRLLSWLLKTLLIVFTTYMSITGVVSGTTDAAAAKATKVTISSIVPVVGGILSDASESVLVSIGIIKNAAGIYGILAVLAICMEPFIRIGIQFLMLKLSAMLCSVFGNKQINAMVEDFSTAMGLLLAMVATGCLLVLISTVCFLKGIS